MSLKHALNSGILSAREDFAKTTQDYISRNAQIFSNIRDLALAFQALENKNGATLFEMRTATLYWGHTLTLTPSDKSNAGIEFELFDNSDLFTVYTPQVSNPKSKRVAMEMASEQEGLEALAKWAGYSAPDAQKELAAAIDNFELNRSITNVEWDCTPTHS